MLAASPSPCKERKKKKEKKYQVGEMPDFKESKGYTNRLWVNI